MNLLLRPLDNASDPVWSVIIMVILALAMAFYVILYILGIDQRESGDSGDQYQSSGNQTSTDRGTEHQGHGDSDHP